MSAETLRRAATLMRERAQAATPPPWWQEEGADLYVYGMVRHGRPNGEGMASAVYFGRTYPESCADAAHIASWHPDVALAVADWLDAEADVIDAIHGHHAEALAVATAYLGEGVTSP